LAELEQLVVLEELEAVEVLVGSERSVVLVLQVRTVAQVELEVPEQLVG
jgi:hypothetical protein